MNFDENTINKLKDMMNKGELNDVISQIPPEMIQGFSSMMSASNNNASSSNSSSSNNAESFNGASNNVSNNIANLFNGNFNNSTNNTSSFNGGSSKNSSNNANFDFSKIDMNTILKMKSIMEKFNNSNDPRSNLLYSLKPYLREEKKGKVDQYANLLNIAKVADLFKDNNKETPNNG